MNFALVSRLLGVVMLILALAFALCLGVSALLDETRNQAITNKAFIAATGTAIFAAVMFFWSGRRAETRFFRKEALCVIGIGWLLASLVGAIPYMIVIPEIGMAGAVFESASGLTTTGASVLTDLESLPKSILFWRCLSQWMGGMGVVVFFVAILGFLGAGAKMLYANEASGSVADFDESRVQTTVKRLIYIYASLSLLCAVAFHLAGMHWFDAICHMFATVSTGGFSTRTASIAAFESPTIEWLAILFMTLGGVSFLLILRLFNGRIGYARRNTELVAYIAILAASSIAISTVLFLEGDVPDANDAFRAATFQVVSIMTTTGFATEDFALWSSLPQTVLLVLMAIGGCSGSTAGGVKVVRLVIALRLCAQSVERSFRSMVVRPVKVNQRTLSERASQEIILYLVLSTFILAISGLTISLFETGHSAETTLSAVQACVFNVGPGLGQVGPNENYADLHAHTKFALSLLMVMGRLELYAILVLFAPSFWRRFA